MLYVFVCMYLICQMQTTDKATTKQCTQWQDSKAQHALTTALDKKKTGFDDVDDVTTKECCKVVRCMLRSVSVWRDLTQMWYKLRQFCRSVRPSVALVRDVAVPWLVPSGPNKNTFCMMPRC